MITEESGYNTRNVVHSVKKLPIAPIKARFFFENFRFFFQNSTKGRFAEVVAYNTLKAPKFDKNLNFREFSKANFGF